MKKVIIGITLSLISVSIFACHINPLGECSGNSYFITKLFNPSSQYVFKNSSGDTLLIFETGPVVIDSIFSLPVPVNTSVFMDYNYIGSSYIEHYTNTSSTNGYAGCSTTPVTLSNVKVKNTGGNIVVYFDAGNETGIDHYEVMASFDRKNWVSMQAINPTGAKSYTIILRTAGGATTAAIFMALILGYKRKKWLSILCIVFVVAFYSCKKEIVQKQIVNYKYYQVQTVDKSGEIILSDIKILKP